MGSRPICGLKILIQEQSVFLGVARFDCTLTMIGTSGLYKHDNTMNPGFGFPNEDVLPI
ncbi:MAG: hypothetical protein DF168_02196 [Candidatus Moanabacter tarae]|uniref:Uncharacterized protein n=1 Tax=Candidatus Moanibacter tarae TaxID=2200854 RepID=A0A2Z4AFI1_9BACT|nr:MAG: hypothetical protein DF168_02196 [Candidatus Moanabacter tarae]